MRKAIAAGLVGLAASAIIATPAQAAPTDVSGYRQWVASQGVRPTPAVVRLGKTICSAKASGMSWNSIVRAGYQAGTSDHVIATVMVGAVYELCPWYINSFNRWVS